MFAHVPIANQSRTNAPLAISISKYGLTAKAQAIPNKKLRAILIVVANFPTNCSYAGLAKLTMLVITIDVQSNINKVVCIVLLFMI